MKFQVNFKLRTGYFPLDDKFSFTFSSVTGPKGSRGGRSVLLFAPVIVSELLLDVRLLSLVSSGPFSLFHLSVPKSPRRVYSARGISSSPPAGRTNSSDAPPFLLLFLLLLNYGLVRFSPVSRARVPRNSQTLRSFPPLDVDHR